MAILRDRGANYMMDYEDSDASFGNDVVSQNEALANIISPPDNKKEEETAARNAVIESLKKQILGQGLTDKWKGEGLGSADANARHMAEIMADTGITDIKQFGQITKTIPGYSYETEQGTVDVPEQTVSTFGNKETGKEVANTYSERQSGNAFGGTFEGSGNTGYRVQFGPDGTPYFYTTQASSNDLANLMQELGPIGQIGLALATGGLSVPQQIAARLAVNVLSGQDIGDAIKGAAISMAVANIPGTDLMKSGGTFIKELGLDDAVTKTLTNSFQNAVTSGATAALTGRNVGDAMIAGATTGGVNGAVNALLNSSDMKELTSDLSDTEKRLVANTITGVISGKPLDQVLINTAIAAANAEIKANAPISAKELGQLNSDEKKIYEESGTKALYAYQRDINNLENLTSSGRTGDDMGGGYDIIENLEKAGLTDTNQQNLDSILEAERVAEIERQRSIEVENERQAELARQAEVERQRVVELERQREIEIEAERQAELERNNIAEEARIAKIEQQRAVEVEAERQAEIARQADEERQAQEARDAEIESQAEVDRQRKAEEARQVELIINAQKQAEEEAAARVAAQERQTAEAQQALESAQKAREEADRLTVEAKSLQDLNDARQAQEEADRLAEASRVFEEERLRLAQVAQLADEERIAEETARLAQEDEYRNARLAEEERIAEETAQLSQEEARKAQEIVIETQRKSEEEALRNAEVTALEKSGLTPAEQDSKTLFDLNAVGGAGTDAETGRSNDPNMTVTGDREINAILEEIFQNATPNTDSGLSNDDILRMINAPADDTVTVTTPKGPDGYTEAERESKRIQDLIAVGGDPNENRVVITDKKPTPEEPVAEPIFQTPVKPNAPNLGNLGEMVVTADRLPQPNLNLTTDPVSLLTDPLAPTTLPTPVTKPEPVAKPSPFANIDPIQALQEFYNPFKPAQSAKPPSQTNTSPIQLMTDIFGTDISKAQKTGARGYGFSAGGDIDELLRLLRS